MNSEEKPRKKRVGLIIVVILLAVLLVGLVAGAIYIKSRLGLVNRVDPSQSSTMSSEEAEEYLSTLETEDDGYTGETMDPSDVTWNTEPTQPPVPVPELINILLIGQDRRAGESRQRSDSMILCTINTKEKTLTMTSFMRDMYVQIPGYKDNRINASYAFGGMKLLNTTLLENFGVEVDANIEVDFNGFEEIVDAMGGVDIDMTRAEVAHLAEFYDYHHLVPGINHLSGEEALAYSRIRYIDSDFQRTGRQRTVLNALIESIREANMVQMLSLVEKALPLIKTDMTDNQIVEYVLDFFPMLIDCEIVSQRVPADYGFEEAEIRDMAVIIADPDATRALLEDITK